jgi:HAD superfamily hydrolase (TIGR01509 family)
MMKAIILDMDGLMVDSERHYQEVEQEMAAKRNAPVPPETIWRMMGRTPIDSLRVFREELRLTDSAEALLEERNLMMRGRLQHDVALMPGLLDILDAFRGKILLGVATGSQREFLEIVIRRFRLTKYFKLLQSSDEIQNGKPDPETYFEAARKLGVAPNECVVLEDAHNGIIAAKRAGCYAIAVPSAWTRGQDFSQADYVAKDLRDAKEHIEKICA